MPRNNPKIVSILPAHPGVYSHGKYHVNDELDGRPIHSHLYELVHLWALTENGEVLGLTSDRLVDLETGRWEPDEHLVGYVLQRDLPASVKPR